MLTCTLDTTSSATGEADGVHIPKGRSLAGGAAPGDAAVPVVAPAPEEERHEVPRQLCGHSSSEWVPLLGITPAATGPSEDARGGEAGWNPGLKLCSLPSCSRQRLLELAVCVHLVKATEMSTAPYQPLIKVNVEGRPGPEAQQNTVRLTNF